jgi:hypothetical protein
MRLAERIARSRSGEANQSFVFAFFVHTQKITILFDRPSKKLHLTKENLLKKRYFLDFHDFFMYVIQHSFICRTSDSTASEDAGIEPRTDATLALTARHSNYLARYHPLLIF